MPAIYEQHDKAFAQVSAYVISKDGEKVATIAFKYPRDGAGRLWVYVHWIGLEMVRGYAGGYGYDKHTAACANAARKMANTLPDHAQAQWGAFQDFKRAIALDEGWHWDQQLQKAGFTVWQAV